MGFMLGLLLGLSWMRPAPVVYQRVVAVQPVERAKGPTVVHITINGQKCATMYFVTDGYTLVSP